MHQWRALVHQLARPLAEFAHQRGAASRCQRAGRHAEAVTLGVGQRHIEASARVVELMSCQKLMSCSDVQTASDCANAAASCIQHRCSSNLPIGSAERLQ